MTQGERMTETKTAAMAALDFMPPHGYQNDGTTPLRQMENESNWLYTCHKTIRNALTEHDVLKARVAELEAALEQLMDDMTNGTMKLPLTKEGYGVPVCIAAWEQAEQALATSKPVENE